MTTSSKSESGVIKAVAVVVVSAVLIGVIGNGLLLWRWQAQASFQISTLTSDVRDIKTILLQGLYLPGTGNQR